MKKITFLSTVAGLTFVIGITTFIFWGAFFTPKSNNVSVQSSVLKESCYPGLSQNINSIHISGSGYFPAGVFSENNRTDLMTSNWYSKQLFYLKEPSLISSSPNSTNPHFRFLWIRRTEPPITIAVQKTNEKQQVIVKKGSKKQKQPIEHEESRSLTKEEWNNLLSKIDAACFWKLSTSPNVISTSGERLILEAIKDEHYHVVSREMFQEPAFQEACEYFLQLSHLDEQLPQLPSIEINSMPTIKLPINMPTSIEKAE